MRTRRTEGGGASERESVAPGRQLEPPSVPQPSHLFFLSVTDCGIGTSGPACLSPGSPPDINASSPSPGEPVTAKGREWGGGHMRDRKSAAGSFFQAFNAQLNGRACLEGRGVSLLIGMGKRGLTCPQEAEGSLIPNSSSIPHPTEVDVVMGGAEGQPATLL